MTVASTAIANDTVTNALDSCIRDYFALLKPGVMALVVFTGFAGLILAPGHIHPLLGALTVLCIAIASGGAGAINMWYDRDIDAKMTRTINRPVPAGKITPGNALAFGVILSAAAVLLLGLCVNLVAGGILALATCFYVFIYTMWLKRRTPQNIVIGGAAGAFPPMIGWAAVTGGVSVESVLMFLVIFFWTPPHFWALALYRCEDYRRVGVPMLPVVAGLAETKKHIIIYSFILVALTAAPMFIGWTGPVYMVANAVLGGVFLWLALRLRKDESFTSAKQLFAYSILYLFAWFTVLLVDYAVRAPGV